jgi:ketosteroid isomerase-like protein
MSDENVNLVRRAFEAVPAPDFETVNALFDRDHEFVSLTSELEGRTWRGASGFREFVDSWGESMDWAVSQIDLLTVTALDADRVLIEGTATTRGRGSGLELSYPRAYLVTVRDRRVARTESYPTADEARAAAKLAD